MDIVLTLVIIVVALLIGFQILVFVKSKKSIGKDIPLESLGEELRNLVKDKKGVIYFYSQNCHNCKSQTPIIEELKAENENIISVDASKDMSSTRALGVMGTPSLIFFSKNKIADYSVGVKSQKFILQKLNKI